MYAILNERVQCQHYRTVWVGWEKFRNALTLFLQGKIANHGGHFCYFLFVQQTKRTGKEEKQDQFKMPPDYSTFF